MDESGDDLDQNREDNASKEKDAKKDKQNIEGELSNPSECDQSKNEPSDNELSKNEPSKDKTSKNELSKNEPSKDEPSKNEPAKSCPKVRKRPSSKSLEHEGTRKRVSSNVPISCKKRRKASSTDQADVELIDQKKVKQALMQMNIETSSKDVQNRNFKCDKCGSPFITNPMIRGNKVKKSKVMPSPRHKLDPVTKKILSLCNACGLAFNRTKKMKEDTVQPSAEEKQKYLDEAQKFAENLAQELGNEEALRLYCTYFTKRPCGCIQRFIGDAKSCESLERGRTLLEIILKARQYKSMKISISEHNTPSGNGQDGDGDENEAGSQQKRQKKRSKRSTIGLGNGQKKSKLFENYVLEQRAWLKKKFGFCETGTKRVLLYSNNFLHKRLKTDPEQSCRVVRQKGKIALGKLTSIEELPKEHCCVDNCVRMAHTHQTLLQEWRDRSKRGQAEARRVIAEMLTPSGGSRTNCHKFVSWVTGRSLTTIGKVNEQMKKTGGNREPPEHGLKKWWKNHPKPKKEKPEAKNSPKIATSVFNQDTAAPIIAPTAFMQPLNILQTATNSAGLTAVIQTQQQQHNQSASSNVPNNGSVIAIPQSFIIQTGQGASFAIPMNALQQQNWQLQQQIQQLQLLQLHQQQQQQNPPAVAVALNPMTNIPRQQQQQQSAPTMVSNGGHQPNTYVIAASATPNMMETMNDISPLISTQQQASHSTTSQQPPATQFLHIATAHPAPSNLLQNSLALLNGALPTAGAYNVASLGNLSAASSGSLNVASTVSLNALSSGNLNLISSGLSMIPQMSTTTEHLLPNENTLAMLNSGNMGQLQGTQLSHLIPQSTNNQIVVNSPIQVSYISGT